MKACIYENGKIFTSDKENLYAEAMLTEDGVIRNVGSREEVEKLAPQDCERVDLQGRRVIPGFVDAHMHPLMLADYSRQISALPPKIRSIEELIQAVREKREEQGPGKWCLGWGLTKESLQSAVPLTAGIWTRAAAILPCRLYAPAATSAVSTAKLWSWPGIDRNTPDPEGGEIERDENGEPTGVLKENARNLITPFMPLRKQGRSSGKPDRAGKTSYFSGDRGCDRYGKFR